MALDLVQLETVIGFPLPAALGVCTLVFWVIGRKKKGPKLQHPTPRPRRAEPDKNAETNVQPNTLDPGSDWLQRAKARAKSIAFPSGSRLLIDTSLPCPVELRLEQAPPERAKRAISKMAEWISSVPTPPRARVVFDHCPEGGAPRHHQVAGALAEHIERSQYRTAADLDAVNILFHHPDPRWTK